MSRRRLWLSAALAGALLLAGAAYLIQAPAELIVLEPGSDRILLRAPVRPGDRFTLSYLHSVAKSRVTGTFEVTPDHRLAVRETAFGSFGPGLPEVRPGDDFEVGRGMIRVRSRDRVLGELSVFVHPFTDHRLEVAGQMLDLSRAVPAGSRVRIGVRIGVRHALLHYRGS